MCNGKTSAFQADDAGSIPAARSNFLDQQKELVFAPHSISLNRSGSHALRVIIAPYKVIIEQPEWTHPLALYTHMGKFAAAFRPQSGV